MNIVRKKLSIEEFKEYLDKKDFGSLPPNFLVIHHTINPTEDSWDGEKSMDSLKKFYENKGWSAGPHIFVAKDGIWLFTDMYEVGIHAGAGNATWKNRNSGTTWQGWGDDFVKNELISYSIGIEVVGNYDGAVWSGDIKENALGTINSLCERLEIPRNKIFFHRDFSTKSCPGWAITKEWLNEKLDEFDSPSSEMKEKYVINYKKIFLAVGKFLKKDYGKNPSDEETKEILELLK